MPSISSRISTAGEAFRAFKNASMSIFSPSPKYIEKTSAAESENTVAPEAVAAARANVVFPPPGGPVSKIPDIDIDMVGELTLGDAEEEGL
jgi:hypothetical protein